MVPRAGLCLALLALILLHRRLRRPRLLLPASCGPVFITGCDTGFGRLLALDLVKKGHFVLAGCLRPASLEQLQTESAGGPGRLLAFELDVTSAESVEAAMRTVSEACGSGGLYALVNNAGIAANMPVHWSDSTLSTYRNVMEVNFFGVVRTTVACLDLLIHRNGRIVNLASMFGRFAPPHVSHYAASKFAVEGFSDSLRREMSVWGVSVSIIEPGFMATNIVKSPERVGMDTHSHTLPLSRLNMYGPAYLKVAQEQGAKIKFDDPMLVVEAIEDALFSTAPQPRYVVGKDARWVFVPLSFLPTAWADWIAARLSPIGTPAAALARK